MYLFKTIVACCFILFSSFSSFAQSPTFEWAEGLGGSVYDYGYGITTDDSGYIYTTGYFQDTVDFDPSSAIFNLVSEGGYDVFVQKLDASGKFIWAKSIGGTGADYAYSILTDQQGSSYTIGRYSSTVDFDPGSGTTSIKSRGSTDIFILKLDRNGNFEWAKSMGGSLSDEGRCLAYDQKGGIYSIGHFNGTVDFDPGSGTNNIVSSGSYDVFIQKLDTSGKFIWAKNIGGSSADYGQSIAADSAGYIYLTGYFSGTADFDPSSSTSNLTSNGGRDVFVEKLDTSGTFEWAIHVGDKSNDYGEGVAVGPNGDVYGIGYFEGTVDFDPGSGTKSLTSAGSTDIFILKLDSKGSFDWAVQNGGTNVDVGASICVNASGSVFSTGYFWGSGDFDPGSGTTTLKSAGGPDVYIQKLDEKGKLVWAESMGGTDYDQGNTIYADNNRNIYTTGFYQGSADFDPGSGTKTLKAAGNNDIFIQKMGECVPIPKSDTVVACDSYKWIDGKTYSANNTNATHILKASTGCDTLVKLHLTLKKSSSSTDTIIACDSFKWIDGNTYFNSDSSATHTSTNQAGCDSIITLNLTLNQSIKTIDTVKSCNSFKWIDGKTYTSSNNTASYLLQTTKGCDSLVYLDLTIIHASSSTDKRVACDSFQWINGVTYYNNNQNATYILNNRAGCDSTITLDLTLSKSSKGRDTQVACESFTWIDGKTYYSTNNTATHMLTNGMGCDSLVSLDLTIISPSYGVDVQKACDSFLWLDGKTYLQSNTTAEYTLVGKAQNGCDSIVRLDLNIISPSNGIDKRMECNSFTWLDGVTYTESNNTAEYVMNGASQNGCDSIVRLDLTIFSVSDISTTLSGETITANNANASYRWLDCKNQYAAIPGETAQSFVAKANGSYAVALQENGCMDTSDCVDITTISIIENSFEHQLTAYPIPTSGSFYVDFKNKQRSLSCRLTSASGVIVRDWRLDSVDHVQVNLEGAAGVYFLEIIGMDLRRAVIRIVKQ
jgi:hypothetical protein